MGGGCWRFTGVGINRDKLPVRGLDDKSTLCKKYVMVQRWRREKRTKNVERERVDFIC